MRAPVLTIVVVSLVILAAHFLRSGNVLFVLACLGAAGLVRVRRNGSRRTLQVVLTLGFLEWMRALLVFVEQRIDAGEPWERLAIILGSVAAVAAAAVIGLEMRALREYFTPPPSQARPRD